MHSFFLRVSFTGVVLQLPFFLQSWFVCFFLCWCSSFSFFFFVARLVYLPFFFWCSYVLLMFCSLRGTQLKNWLLLSSLCYVTALIWCRFRSCRKGYLAVSNLYAWIMASFKSLLHPLLKTCWISKSLTPLIMLAKEICWKTVQVPQGLQVLVILHMPQTLRVTQRFQIAFTIL